MKPRGKELIRCQKKKGKKKNKIKFRKKKKPIYLEREERRSQKGDTERGREEE